MEVPGEIAEAVMTDVIETEGAMTAVVEMMIEIDDVAMTETVVVETMTVEEDVMTAVTVEMIVTVEMTVIVVTVEMTVIAEIDVIGEMTVTAVTAVIDVENLVLQFIWMTFYKQVCTFSQKEISATLAGLLF